MRARALGVILAVLVAVPACAPARMPSRSAATSDACGQVLPTRTSSTDFPAAILHVAGEDLAPVVGEVEWLGGDEPIATIAPRAVNLERFTVLQVRDVPELSLRMTGEVLIAEWLVTALPDGDFRRGDFETGTEWSSGEETTELVCVPIENGSWAIRADLTFADQAGTGTYYWRLNVSESPSG